MSFKAVQSKIEGEGYNKKAAGAILAKGTRNSSPAAKKANPNLSRVEMPAKKSMHIEQADNGGFISRTSQEGRNYDPGVKNVHTSTNALVQHVRKTFPPAPQNRTRAAVQPAWAGVANSMLGQS